jgi:hypothetical protein
MLKRILLAGFLGWIVLVVCVFVANGIFGFYSRIALKRVPDESRVYGILKETIVEAGRYVCNPALTSSGQFPVNEPVFSILYGGVGHEAAGRMQWMHYATSLVATLMAAWMLSGTSGWILSSYPRRVLFLSVLGLLMAVFRDLPDMGIGAYPARDAVMLAGFTFVTWLFASLAIAWPVGAKPGVASQT